MNPEDIYNSIRKASADIQNLSKLDPSYDENKKERDSTSQDSGIQVRLGLMFSACCLVLNKY